MMIQYLPIKKGDVLLWYETVVSGYDGDAARQSTTYCVKSTLLMVTCVLVKNQHQAE